MASSKAKESTQETLKHPYAVVQLGSQQFRVSEGDTVLAEKINGEPGSSFDADQVLLSSKAPGEFQVGKPLVKGAKVKFEILQQTLDKKILIRHHRRRHNSQKTRGHRQAKTRLLVTGVSA